MTLTGYVGKTGTRALPTLSSLPAGQAAGLENPSATLILVTYQVSNPGQLALKDLAFSTANGSRPDWIRGDDNHNARLDPGEIWEYAALETAVLGPRQTQIAVQAIATNEAGDPLGLPSLRTNAGLYYTGTQAIPTGDLTDPFGKVKALTFQYVENDDVLTGGKGNSQNGKARILGDSQRDSDGLSFIIVTDEKNGRKAFEQGKGDRYFQGDVSVGGFFKASDTLDRFGTKIYIHFYDDGTISDGIECLQSVGYRTAGSQPIQIGNRIGNATLVEYFGENGAFDTPSIFSII